ncbi:MAG: hypothetical protein FWG85_07560 [Bacteroidetes bacterium]|nr:hypothetical protein [Bacteroidota bacterium]
MQKEVKLMFIFFILVVASCRNYEEYKYISKNFERKYTGLDTLIRLDGYYYYYAPPYRINQSTGDYRYDSLRYLPIVFSKNSEYNTFGCFSTHERIQEHISRFNYYNGGYYKLSGDTIKAQAAARASLNSWAINYRQYIIENDTTLRLISSYSNTGYAYEQNPIRNEIYRFYKYP